MEHMIDRQMYDDDGMDEDDDAGNNNGYGDEDDSSLPADTGNDQMYCTNVYHA